MPASVLHTHYVTISIYIYITIECHLKRMLQVVSIINQDNAASHKHFFYIVL